MCHSDNVEDAEQAKLVQVNTLKAQFPATASHQPLAPNLFLESISERYQCNTDISIRI